MKALIVLFVVLLASCTAAKNSSSMAAFADNPVIAHRGAWKANKFPENSIASVKEAVRLGCTGTEFDIWMTMDDSLVVNHDPHYNKIAIEKAMYAELLDYRLPNGENIPTLREYLLAGLSGNSKTMMVLEIKPSTVSVERGRKVADRVVALVKELNARSMSAYISFDYEILKQILLRDPEAKTQYLKGDIAPSQLKKDGMDGLDYHFSVFKKNPEWIAEAKKHQLKLNAWTVNDAKEMENLLDSGFHYITTNEPELLFQIVQKRKSR